MTPPPEHPRVFRFTAAAAADATGFVVAPACLLVEIDAPSRREGVGGWVDSEADNRPRATGPETRVTGRATLLAIGTPDALRSHPAFSHAQVIHRPDAILLPGLVNAHTHLDLTHIGPRPHDPALGFLPWVDMIRSSRATSPDAIAASVRRGIELSLAGGVVAVGDIAGAVGGRPSLTAATALHDSLIRGISFIEFFGQGTSQDRAIAALADLGPQLARESSDRVRLGLQPHAPYSVGPRAYAAAIDLAASLNLPIATHLAESPEERDFVARAQGPLVDLLRSVGVWTDQTAGDYRQGLSPIVALAPSLAAGGGRLRAVHVNQASDDDLATLAAARTTVIYCPRASAYFAAERHFGPHRYRDMLAAGIPVALGTDSIVNLPQSAADASTGGISTLDEMRLLWRRDQTDPLTLLAMATTHGAKALHLDPSLFSFTGTPHAIAGLIAVGTASICPSPIRCVLDSPAPPEPLLIT